MFEHIGNCHGEWNALFAMLVSLPVIGAWLRAKLHRKHKHK